MKTLKNISGLALIALALVYTYNVINPVLEKTPEKTNLPLAIAPKVNAPTSGAAISAEKPKVHIDPPIDLDKMPDGEFVITNRAYQMTDAGIKSFPVGERVYKVEGGYTNGKITIPVDESRLTNSRSVADSLIIAVRPLVPPAPVLNPEPPKVNVPASDATINQNEAYNASIDQQIEGLNDKIRDLTYKQSSRINANGPVISRLRMQIQKLEALKR